MADNFGCTVSELLHRISSDELTEWKAYYKIIDDERKEEEKKADKKGNKGQKDKGQLGSG